ncbi:MULTISPECIES: hypothetical protein [unclassified Wolbachia]|nr:hypothetical protein [Wolbachia endosymbiont (group A) of Apoderus coryli]
MLDTGIQEKEWYHPSSRHWDPGKRMVSSQRPYDVIPVWNPDFNCYACK